VSPRVREDSVHSRLQSGASVRPLKFTVRFRMNRALLFALAVSLVVRLDASYAQPHTGITIVVASDGTCQAAGLHVACRDIGARLREAGIPKDTWITFSGAATLRYDIVKPMSDSLTRAGFDHVKIGFITAPAPR